MIWSREMLDVVRRSGSTMTATAEAIRQNRDFVDDEVRARLLGVLRISFLEATFQPGDVQVRLLEENEDDKNYAVRRLEARWAPQVAASRLHVADKTYFLPAATFLGLEVSLAIQNSLGDPESRLVHPQLVGWDDTAGQWVYALEEEL